MREGDKWRVVSGDCLWNISRAVYGTGTRWPEIAAANGLPTSGNPIIYPGQLFVLPGITGGAPALAPAASPAPQPVGKVNIDWFSLTAGSQRNMECLWSWSGVQHFWIKWEYYDINGHKWVQSETTNYYTTTGEPPQAQCNYGDEAKRCRISIRPVNADGNGFQPNTEWAILEYDFSNNPPTLPPDPDFEIDSLNRLTATFNNIDEDINADSIEIAIYQDNTYKYQTVKVGINMDARFATYIGEVDPGHYYKIRCRAVRGDIYGGWTNFTSNDMSRPLPPTEITTLRPQVISEQGAKQYGIFVEWDEALTAKQYEVQWTTNVEYFDISGGNVNSQTTEENAGPRILVTNVEVGHDYFFRVRSINDKGPSLTWSPIRQTALGIVPAAPTTWSNTSSAILGEDLNLYWTHNSEDGSREKRARIHILTIDSAHPELVPAEYYKIVENERPEEEQDSNGVYTINTEDQEWSGLLSDGFIIKWKVQTAGVMDEYGEWSVEREINVYSQPTLELDITNKDGVSVEEINGFPFYLNVLARPVTQTPISYYVEIISNDGYSISDNVGETKVINPGDKVYQKYYDPERNAWRFLVEMSPSNVDLKSGANYTVNVLVAMDSGLTANVSSDFDVELSETGYSPYANIIIDKITLTASINPYCMENYEDDGEIKQRMTDDCLLYIYRREPDGTFTEIESNIENAENVYVMDPHPALDYARYRIVAKAKDTGTISYCDVEAVKVGEPSIVIQWSEKWSRFDYDPDDPSTNVEVPWAGSMLKLPYNINTSENKNLDVSLVEYAGRKHPVSYYGTQIGEEASWSTEIPANDKETLYGLRRLSRWNDDVYVREPSGTGYWASISVSLNIAHLATTIPVSFNVKRVEGGI